MDLEAMLSIRERMAMRREEESRKSRMKYDFDKSSRKLCTLKNALSKVEKDIAMLKAGPQRELTPRLLEMRLDLKRVYESDIEGHREQLVNIYKYAIMQDWDVDGSRLLKVYRFFYRNSAQLHIQLAFVNVPRGSNAVWGIIVLTAIMFLYAAV